MSNPEPSYLVKTINFDGRRVPILLQDINGPCPLLAIANTLLLRGRVQLPEGVGEVSQERCVALVAEHLLDSNAVEHKQGLSEEYKANLQQNLADAIALLPKLTTGVDVNVRFHDIRGFEYTDETAVFDLLDIPLVHGWICDPQDELTAAALGNKSYNEVVMALVTALGSAATPPAVTPTRQLTPSTSGVTTAAGTQAPAMAAPAATPGGTSAGAIDAGALAAALQHSLHVSTQPPSGRRSLDQHSSVSSVPTSASSRMSDPAVSRMISDLVKQAFASDSISGSMASTLQTAPEQEASGTAASLHPGGVRSSAAEERALMTLTEEGALSRGGSSGGLPQAVSPSAEGLDYQAQLLIAVDETDAQRPAIVTLRLAPVLLVSPFESQPLSMDIGSEAGNVPALPVLPSSGSNLVGEAPATSAPSGAAALAGQSVVAEGSAPSAAAPAAGAAATPADAAGPSSSSASGSRAAAGWGAGPPPSQGAALAGVGGSADVREALLMQQYLEAHPSQLTYHGLLSLHEGLKDGQLAVFFRNNHFNTLHARGGRLFILVTDQGYQFEPDVVWEELTSVDGDTQLVDSGFRPFVPHAAAAEQGAGGAAGAAEWESTTAAQAAAAAAAGNTSMDADLALAMQLQAEEEERVRVEEHRRREAAARQAAEQRRQQHAAAAGVPQRPDQALPSQQRPAKPKKDKKSSDCVLM